MYKPATKRSKPTYTLKINSSFTRLVEYYISLGLDFEAHIGGKSHTLVFPNVKEKYLTDFVKQQAFIAARMIKRDVDRDEVEATLSDIRDTINEDDNRYYNSKPAIPYDIGDCYLVDINSAYLSVLRNFDLITENTYNYVNMKCPKKERLVAVGMLAQRKQIYQIEKGKIIGEPELVEAPTRYLFNLCIQEVDNAMQEVSKAMPDSFLFYWVDGIYISSKNDALKAMEILKKQGFKSKMLTLEKMTCMDIFIRKEISFTEIKEDGTKKKKLFRVPNAKLESEFKAEMRRILAPKI